MQIQIKLDPAYPEPTVWILTEQITDEVTALLQQIEAPQNSPLVGYTSRNHAVLIEPEQLIRLYGAQQKVYAKTPQGEFTLRHRLYELEQQLSSKQFVRISHSEIVNLRYIQRLDLSIAGTIGIHLKNGDTAYVSRRYLSKIKAILRL